MLIEIENKTEFEEKVLNAEGRILVDFFATWCGPCKMQLPIIDALVEENKNINVAKVDIDKNRDIAMEYNIMSVPTLALFENGKIVKEVLGLHSKDDLLSLYNM